MAETDEVPSVGAGRWATAPEEKKKKDAFSLFQ